MHMFAVALLAATTLSNTNFVEPSEDAMREAFASDLSSGVKDVIAYVVESGGPQALARIRAARTDEYEIRGFRKVECRRDDGGAGQNASAHVCVFVVEIDTVAGPFERSIDGRFIMGPCGLAYGHDA